MESEFIVILPMLTDLNCCREPVCVVDHDNRLLIVGVPPHLGLFENLKGQEGQSWNDYIGGIQAVGKRCHAAMNWEGHNSLPSPSTKA